MDPFLYVEEEYENVSRALDESLRHDYGPNRTDDYFHECKTRLELIKEKIDEYKSQAAQGPGSTSSVVSDLWDLSNHLMLIERSHLGEFSWPFADAIKEIAVPLLTEDGGLQGPIAPIVHMIAEGTSYKVSSESILDDSKAKRMYTVAFPRQLKHHVLMHALFGHELGHAIFYSSRKKSTGGISGEGLGKRIRDIFQREGPLKDCAAVAQWLKSADAPGEIKARRFKTISQSSLSHLHVELVSDLLGLMIFGPAFAAAHRAYLEPSCRSHYLIETDRKSHPSFAVRRNLLIDALDIRGWLSTSTGTSYPRIRRAEQELIEYIGGPKFTHWATVFTKEQIAEVLDLVELHFSLTGTKIAQRPSGSLLNSLVKRIERHQPPIRQELDTTGRPKSYPVKLEEQLYAGWTYFVGREGLNGEPLSFLAVNQLCELAILQQQAIDLSEGRRVL